MHNIRIIIFALFISNLFAISIFAQSASPSASPLVSASPDPEITAILKERVEKTLAENPVPKRSRWYGIFGTITSKTGDDTLSLTKSDSTTATIIVTEDTQLSFYKSGSPTRKIKISDIQQDWFAIAMGTEMADNLTLTASRISFSSPLADMPKRTLIHGKVTEIDDTSITLTNGKTSKITIPKKYEIKVQGVNKATIDDININDKAVAVVEDLINADTVTSSLLSVYIVPSSANPKFAANQINEASGSGVATPSATTKPPTLPATRSKNY